MRYNNEPDNAENVLRAGNRSDFRELRRAYCMSRKRGVLRNLFFDCKIEALWRRIPETPHQPEYPG